MGRRQITKSTLWTWPLGEYGGPSPPEGRSGLLRPSRGGRVFVGSDDGQVYCLNAGDGKVQWTFSGGPRAELLLGNGRMMSRWPIRTGVAVENGVVYFAAGTWPSEGVLLYALNAADGKPMWVNDTSGTMYVTQPHPGSFSMTGVTPQGYVLGHKGQIFVPTGRNVPAAYDRSNGKVMYYRSAPSGWGNRWGGCWNFLADGLLVGWRCHIGPDIDVLIGEYKPDPRDGIVVFDAKTGKEIREVGGPLRAVIRAGTLYTSGGGKVCATDLAAWLKGAGKSKWEAPQGRTYELIMAGDTLVAGGQDTVKAIDAGSGKVAWEAKVAGQARGLAVAQGRLLVSTTEGEILCYGPNTVSSPTTVSYRLLPAGRPRKGRELARRIVTESGKTIGHCLVLGAGDGSLLQQLALESGLTVDCVDADAAKVAAARGVLGKFRQYGVRVSVRRGSLSETTYPDYFADLIVVGATDAIGLDELPAKELYRILRPCGGVAYVLCAKIRGGTGAVQQWLQKGGVPAGETRSVRDTVQVVRGRLPGADNWTHQYASPGRTGASSDQRARLPLKLLWFGEPGPMRLVTRHWGGAGAAVRGWANVCDRAA